jgi:hypothetical protein
VIDARVCVWCRCLSFSGDAKKLKAQEKLEKLRELKAKKEEFEVRSASTQHALAPFVIVFHVVRLILVPPFAVAVLQSFLRDARSLWTALGIAPRTADAVGGAGDVRHDWILSEVVERAPI